MKVIVFGGSGFVGSHVADALSAAGHQVTLFDIQPSRYLHQGQRFIQGDIMDKDAVRHAVASQEIVYNFAGLADIDDAFARPLDTVRLNVEGCVNQLEAAREAGIRRFVFASSIYVYSESGGFYRCSKQACELYVEEYQRRFGLDYTILRFGTIYGRRADERNTVHRCLRQALLERRIVVTGLPEAIREYIHVEDAARASEQILGNEFRNQNVILTGQHTMRFRDLLQMIREIVGADVQIEINPPGKVHDAIGHYSFTPYTFHPKIAKKLVNNYYLDMGQGLLDCLEEINQPNDALDSATALTRGQ
jgi:UDP-glucose 4-epimerase